MAEFKIDVLSEEFLAEDQLIEETDEQPEEQPDLRDIIENDWKLQTPVYSILISHGITLDYLKVIDEKALNDIFSVVKWTGHKHALRSKLEQWTESALYRPTVPLINPINEAPSSQNTLPGPSQRRFLQTAVTNNELLSILERNEKGKIVCQYYEANRRLDLQHRRYLAHTIVDYYIANNSYFTLADMDRYSELIAARFPTELSVIYYNPRNAASGKKHPSGLLYDRFHNRKKASLPNRRRTEVSDPWTICKAKASNLTEKEINRLTSIKNWLRNNLEPFDEVLLRWNDSVLLRIPHISHDTDTNKSNTEMDIYW
ncbi:uncharacterized protein LOC134210312 [Armigeres subalbatus]|uniref:uncharacterized protein LOC134210312 n=1 Tax=Armigeres subalbatus TaxID=124917 RepID=UPI002ED5A22B